MARTGIIVLGSINMDLVARVPRMPRPGETVLGGRFSSNLGGKGANQAVAAARAASGPVALVAAVGDDAHGRAALAALGGEPRLSLEHVKTVAGEASGVALIMVDAAGENMISVASGANGALAPTTLTGCQSGFGAIVVCFWCASKCRWPQFAADSNERRNSAS